MHRDTQLIHAGVRFDAQTGEVADSIRLSTTYRHGPAAERLPGGFEYQREGHANTQDLEQALAVAEGGVAAIAFTSGMAAIAAAFAALTGPGKVIVPRDVYNGTRIMAREFLIERGFSLVEADCFNTDATLALLDADTRLLWLETPSNPRLMVSDIAALCERARALGIRTVVDNTFASPVVQQPLKLGADVVMHSLTKYVGGHSDVMGGALVFARQDEFAKRAEHHRHLHGAHLPPFNAWLCLRGLRTLHVRMARHVENAGKVAAFLATHAKVARVHYPGLASHPQHAVAARQMQGFGGMVSFEMASREQALQVASRVKLFINATSLGGVESLIEHRESTELSPPKSPAELLRLSIGLEHADDLIADLEQALR